MFDFVHTHRRVVQVVLGLMTIPFAVWGIESYTRSRGGADTVATVNGLTISQREFSEELGRQQEQLRRMFGRNIDPAAFDTPESRQALLDSLISQRLMASAAQKAHLSVSDEAPRERLGHEGRHIDERDSRPRPLTSEREACSCPSVPVLVLA